MLWCVALVSLIVGAQAFVLAPIRWAGVPARNLFLAPTFLPTQPSLTPQSLTISDQHGPHFAAHSDSTIRVERSNQCIEASGSRIGDAVRINFCSGDRPLQKWNWLSRVHGQDRIQLAGTQNCLAAVEKQGGLNVELRACDNTAAEAWMFEEPIPQTSKYTSGAASDSIRHAAIFVFLMVALAAFTFSAWFRRKIKSLVVTTRWSDTPLIGDEGGVALTLPFAEHQDSAPSTPDADIMFVQRMVPAVMALAQIAVKDDADTQQPARVHSDVAMMPRPGRPANTKPYTVPPTTRNEWLSSNIPLFQERIIYLGELIDDAVINRCISQLLSMDGERNAPIYLYINSPGGSVIAGMALYDTMQHVKSDVITINTGIAASTASLLFGAGLRGKRIALANARVMIHQPAGGDDAEVESLDRRVEADQIKRIKDTVISMYADQTGHTREKIAKDISNGDYYMSAQEALEYGLVDVLVPEPEGLLRP